MANVKDMSQAQDDPRMGAIKRRMQKQPPQKQTDQDQELTNERKNMGY